VLTNDSGAGVHQVVIRRPGVAAEAGAGRTFTLKEDNVGETVRRLRRVLADRASGETRRSREALRKDLQELAPIGWSLYTQIGAQLEKALFEQRKEPGPLVIQVLRPTSSSLVLPWGWCYSFPLDDYKKPWPVCRRVDEWEDGEAALFDPAALPRACPEDHPPSNVLCPFGFIGMRHAIEQLSSTDKPVLTIASEPSCDFAAALTQYKLQDPKALERHVGTLRALAGAAGPKGQFGVANDRVSVQKLLGRDLSFVYFFCHGDRPVGGDANIYLAVGNNEATTALNLFGWFSDWSRELDREIWGDVRPLVFINACHSLAIEPETLVSYLDAFVTRGNAAGVIGTEVKVPQSLAMDLAEKFFQRLLSRKHTVESALHEIRLEYLAAGNLFGLMYTPYCWADLRLA
jgi:hypothetical protein